MSTQTVYSPDTLIIHARVTRARPIALRNAWPCKVLRAPELLSAGHPFIQENGQDSRRLPARR